MGEEGGIKNVELMLHKHRPFTLEVGPERQAA